MASEKKKYTAEFKKEVASKALNLSRPQLDELSEEYDVPVSMIQLWASKLQNAINESENVFESSEAAEKASSEHEEIDVEITSQRVAKSVEHGVMDDKLNYKRLVFWSVFGTVLVIVFVQALFEMFQYNQQLTQERVSAESEYYQVNELKKEANKQLDSFGVVDLENGIYRIPIDSAINEMAADEE